MQSGGLGMSESQTGDPSASGSQSGLGLTQSKWAQLSQMTGGAQAATPLADPSSSDQPVVPGALSPDQIQRALDAWSSYEDALHQGNPGDGDYWLRQYYTYCGCSSGPADSGGGTHPPSPPTPTSPPITVPPPTIAIPAPSL